MNDEMLLVKYRESWTLYSGLNEAWYLTLLTPSKFSQSSGNTVEGEIERLEDLKCEEEYYEILSSEDDMNIKLIN